MMLFRFLSKHTYLTNKYNRCDEYTVMVMMMIMIIVCVSVFMSSAEHMNHHVETASYDNQTLMTMT